MFRTQTGQTGRDAYVNELAQIANSYRALQARHAQLVANIRAENPDLQITQWVNDEFSLDLPMHRTVEIMGVTGAQKVLDDSVRPAWHQAS